MLLCFPFKSSFIVCCSLRSAASILPSLPGGLCRLKPPALPHAPLTRREDETVDGHPNGDDDEHDGNHLPGIVEVASRFQEIAQAQGKKEEFTSHQRAPGKGPALLEPG